MKLKASIIDLLAKIPVKRVFIGFSGGVDSLVLLHILSFLRDEISKNIIAVHINHGLSANADSWQHECEVRAKNLGIEFKAFNVKLDASKASIEAQARDARYEVFEKLPADGDGLILAQHQDDQIETFFLRLMRGAGSHGLQAMREVRDLGSGKLLRPWLQIPKSEILEYAKTHKLKWIEDETNKDIGPDRNFLRLIIIPKLKTRWPGLNKTISRTIRHLALSEPELDFAERLSVTDLSEDVNEAGNVVYSWLKFLKAPLPSFAKILNIVKEVAWSKQDALAHVSWPGGEVRRFKSELYFFTKRQNLKPLEYSVSLKGQEVIDLARNQTALEFPAHAEKIKLKIDVTKEGLAIKPDDKVRFEFPRGGEKIKPAGSKHSKSLKNLFQENNIPPWQRVRTPLVFVNDELLAVPGVCFASTLKSANATRVLMEIN